MNLVPKTIAKQINTLDPMAFFAWGSSDLTAFSEDEDSLGALRWRVRNCKTFKGVAFIKVTLSFDDTYSVKLYKHKNLTKKLREKLLTKDFDSEDTENIIERRESVYAEDLVSTIDEMLGEKTKTN